ncbi:MAG TPA: hypothetical protein EYH54_04175, partial [Nautiliaceae bacterium]|nr:hypothetical protein [Nautiliaceae bacterium]
MEVLERAGLIVLGVIFLVIFSFFIYNSYLENSPFYSERKDLFKIEKLDTCEQFQKLFNKVIKKESGKNIYYIKNKLELKTILEKILREYPPCIDCNNKNRPVFFKLTRDFLILSWNKDAISGSSNKKGDYCVVLIKDKDFSNSFELQLALIPRNRNIKNSQIFSHSKMREIKNKLEKSFFDRIKEKKLLIKFSQDKEPRKIIFDRKTYFIQPSLIFLLSNKFDLVLESNSYFETIKEVGFIVYINLYEDLCLNFKKDDEVNQLLKKTHRSFFVIPNYLIDKNIDISIDIKRLTEIFNEFKEFFYISFVYDVLSTRVC